MPLRIFFKDYDDMERRIVNGNLYQCVKSYLINIMEEERTAVYEEKLNIRRAINCFEFQFDDGTVLNDERLEESSEDDACILRHIIMQAYEEAKQKMRYAKDNTPQTIKQMQTELLQEIQEADKSNDIRVALCSDSIFMLITNKRHYAGAYRIDENMKYKQRIKVYDDMLSAIRRV